MNRKQKIELAEQLLSQARQDLFHIKDEHQNMQKWATDVKGRLQQTSESMVQTHE